MNYPFSRKHETLIISGFLAILSAEKKSTIITYSGRDVLKSLGHL